MSETEYDRCMREERERMESFSAFVRNLSDSDFMQIYDQVNQRYSTLDKRYDFLRSKVEAIPFLLRNRLNPKYFRVIDLKKRVCGTLNREIEKLNTISAHVSWGPRRLKRSDKGGLKFILPYQQEFSFA